MSFQRSIRTRIRNIINEILDKLNIVPILETKRFSIKFHHRNPNVARQNYYFKYVLSYF